MKKLSSKQRDFQNRRRKKRFSKELRRKEKRILLKRAYRNQAIKMKRELRVYEGSNIK